MAIALSCPGCVQALKVKDELAGRKIKCPKCGTVIPVPEKRAGKDERVMAKAPRTESIEEDDEPQEEKRPKKKKKKKAKSNRGVLIGAAVGGVVLILIVVLILMLPGGGDKAKVVQKRPEPEPAQPQQAAVAPPDEDRKAPVGGLARSREVTTVQNELRQLGIAYRNFETLENRGPKDQKELASYYENNGEINEALTKKWLTFIWGAPRQSLAEHGASNTILGYETDADRQGIRMVLLGDGSVRGMDEDEFQKTPKAKAKGK
jgi:DNA-directed RNA polymerase subunit M/transcription elongation factor TFIIS